MTARLLALGCFVSLTAVAARAADEPANPYKDAKVGDSVTYKLTIKAAGQTIDGTATQTVTAKTDKEATVEMKVKAGPIQQPAVTQKIDLTKPYDPAAASGLPPGSDLKVEKLKDGKEKVTVGGKEYDATWSTYKMSGKVMGLELSAEVKAWMGKGVPLGLLKSESSMSAAGQQMEMTMEFSEATKNKTKD